MDTLKWDNSEKYVFEIFKQCMSSKSLTGESLFWICDVKGSRQVSTEKFKSSLKELNMGLTDE